METTVQQFRERLFNAKRADRQRSASDPFFEKLEHVKPPSDSSSMTALPSSVRRVLGAMAEAEKAAVIGGFAITGGMAITYHSEPVYTLDLDVLAFIPGKGGLINLGPIYDFFSARGAAASGEYLLIDGLKFQFIPAATPLESESLHSAITATEQDSSFRIIDLEYLIALKLAAGRNKDLLHIQILLDAPRRPVDFSRLEKILKTHDLSDKWHQFRSRFTS
jgi:hypothetical protein